MLPSTFHVESRRTERRRADPCQTTARHRAGPLRGGGLRAHVFERASVGDLAIPLPRRFTYAPDQNIFFINFERLEVKTKTDVEAIKAEVERYSPLAQEITWTCTFSRVMFFSPTLTAISGFD